jgi:multidrug transporter EmrE-like cation transporter
MCGQLNSVSDISSVDNLIKNNIKPSLYSGGFFVTKIYYICYHMSLSKVLIATIVMILGQIGSFMQLQGAIKYGWYEKYMWIILLSSVPISYLYIVAVRMYVDGFEGQIWPSRLIGFALGIMVFTIMSILLFNEHMTTKNAICLVLSFSVVLIQLFWK